MTVPSFRIETGDMLEIEGVLHDIRDRDREGMLLSVTIEGRPVTRKIAHKDLLDLYFANKLRIRRGVHEKLPEKLARHLGRTLDGYPSRIADEALRRYDYVDLCDRYFAARKAPRTPAGFARIGRVGAWLRRRRAAAEAGRAARFFPLEDVGGWKLRDWHRRWEKSGRSLSVMVPMHADKGNREERLDPAVVDIVERCLRNHWLTNERLPMSIAIEAIEGEIDRSNAKNGAILAVPSGTAIRAIAARTFPDYEVVARREGRAAAEQKFRHVRKPREPQRPLEVIEIDHTRLDVFVVDRSGNEVRTVRPWLTVAICAATRMVVGFHISLDAPSWTSIMAALRMGVRPKDALLASDPDLKSPWPVLGVGEMVRTDNGLEFHSNSLKAAAGHLGFRILYTPRRKPHLKGRVERFLGEIARNMTAVPGRTFRDVRERGDYKSQEKVRYTLEQVQAMFLVWVVDYYHNRPHAGLLGRTPLQVWTEKAEAFDVRLPPSVDELDALIALVIDRTVTNEGVQYLGLDYQSARIQAMRRARKHMGKLWRVKVDPGDLSQVLVFDEDAGRWIAVPSTSPDLTDGLTLPMWKEIVATARASTKEKQKVSRQTLLDTRARLLAMAGRGTTSAPPRMSEDDEAWGRQVDESSFADVAALVQEEGGRRRKRNRANVDEDAASVSRGKPAMEFDRKTGRASENDRAEPATKTENGPDLDPDDPDGWS